MIVTGTHDPVRARDQLLNKFYAVALVDADTPTPGGGIELLQFARDKSPLTSVVIMTARKSYETAVKAFRAGAADVVLKEPDVVPYLRERVVEAATDIKATADRNSLARGGRLRPTRSSCAGWRDVARGAGPARGSDVRSAPRRAGTSSAPSSVVRWSTSDPKARREAGEGADRRGLAGSSAPAGRARARRLTSCQPGAPADRDGQGRPCPISPAACSGAHACARRARPSMR